MRRTRTRMDGSRFDNRTGNRRYRRDGRRDFDSQFKDFKKFLDRLIFEGDDARYPMDELTCIVRISEDIINAGLWRGKERVYQAYTWFYGLDGVDAYPYLYDLRKRLNTKPYITREGIAVLEYEGEDMFILVDRKTREVLGEAFSQAFSG